MGTAAASEIDLAGCVTLGHCDLILALRGNTPLDADHALHAFVRQSANDHDHDWRTSRKFTITAQCNQHKVLSYEQACERARYYSLGAFLLTYNRQNIIVYAVIDGRSSRLVAARAREVADQGR